MIYIIYTNSTTSSQSRLQEENICHPSISSKLINKVFKAMQYREHHTELAIKALRDAETKRNNKVSKYQFCKNLQKYYKIFKNIPRK